MVVLELSINSSMRQLHDLVAALEVTTLDLLEVPRHQQLSSRGHNTCLVDLISIVKSGGCEVDELDLVLNDVLGINGQLEWLGLVLYDGLGEAWGTFVVLSGYHEYVSLASGQYPLLVLADVNRPDGLSQTRQHSLGNLTHLLVHSNVTIGWADNETTVDVCAHWVEHNVGLISLRQHDTVITDSGVKLMHALSLKAQYCAGCVLLTIFGFVAKLVEFDVTLACLHLLDYLAWL